MDVTEIIIEGAKAFLNAADHVATATERYEKALGDTVTQIERTGASGFSRDEVVSHAERISRERSLTEIEVLQGIQFASTFQSLDEDEIIRVIELANDRAESGGGDFLSNIGTLANALQNLDTSGLGLLERDRTDVLKAALVDPDEAQKLILDALRRNIAEAGVLDRDNLIDLRHLVGVELESAERAVGGTMIGQLARDAVEEYEETIRKLSRVVTDTIVSSEEDDLESRREAKVRQAADSQRKVIPGEYPPRIQKAASRVIPLVAEEILRLDAEIRSIRHERAVREAAIDEKSQRIQDVISNQQRDEFRDAMGEPVGAMQLFDPESLEAFQDTLTKAFRDVGEEICACIREDKETEFAESLSPTSVSFMPGARGSIGPQLLVAEAATETGLSGGGTFVAEDFGRAGREGFEDIREAARLASRTVVDAFEDWIKGSLDAKDALESFARQLSEIALQKFVLDPFERVLSRGADGLGDGISDLFDFGLGSVFGGGRTPPIIPPISSISLPRIAVPLAEGGLATAGDPFLVGERGPELFVPFESGAVVPNDRLGGETVVNQTITVHVHGGINNQGRMTPGQVAAQIGSELARQSRRNN